VKARLLIDECLSPQLVDIAIAAGHVETTCALHRGLLGAKDWGSPSLPLLFSRPPKTATIAVSSVSESGAGSRLLAPAEPESSSQPSS
jgi:hypothetical protein